MMITRLLRPLSFTVSVLSSAMFLGSCNYAPDAGMAPELTVAKPGNGQGRGPGGGSPEPEPLVDLIVPPGSDISDDGSGPYVTGECGVYGVIYEGSTENVSLTTNAQWDPALGCTERFLGIDLTHGINGENLGSGTLNSFGVSGLNVAAPNDGQWHNISVQALGDNCKRLRWDAGDTGFTHINTSAPWISDNARAMRVEHPTDPAKRAWIVETFPPDPDGTRHDMAVCFHNGNGPKRFLDGFFYASFSILIVEQ